MGTLREMTQIGQMSEVVTDAGVERGPRSLRSPVRRCKSTA